MSNKIRSVSERKEVMSTENVVHTHTMVYTVGGRHPIRVNGEQKPTIMEVATIEETETKYLVYLKYGDEVQLWKELPKNEYTTIEHSIS